MLTPWRVVEVSTVAGQLLYHQVKEGDRVVASGIKRRGDASLICTLRNNLVAEATGNAALLLADVDDATVEQLAAKLQGVGK